MSSTFTLFNSPLEQFEIIPLISRQLAGIDLSRTNTALMMMACAGVLTIGMQSVLASGNGTIVPNRWQTVVESIYNLVLSMIGQTMGVSGVKFFPMIFTLFTFILACNLFGLVPYSYTVTSQLVVTMTLSLMIWIGKLILGIRLHGIKLLSMFLPQGTPFAMYWMMVPLEMMGYTITFISLSVRLFANMVAGHILLKVIAGFAWTMMASGGLLYIAHFIPMGVLFLLLILETAVACIQAYVFTLLSCIYIADMIHGGH
jgi:ATP synthase subunit 6